MFIQRDSASARRPPLLALAVGLLAVAACADQPTSVPTGATTGAGGATGASAANSVVGAGGDLGDAHILFFAAEDEAVDVESDNPSNPSSVDRGDARLFTLPVERDCANGDSSCVAFTRSGESSPTRLRVSTAGLLVHVFAGASDLGGDVTIDAADVAAPAEGKVGLHYRSLAPDIEYGVLGEGSAFQPLRAGFNQIDVDVQFASFDSDAGIVRIDLPEPFEEGGRYAMVVGEEPGGHFVTYCALDGDEEACSSFSSDAGS